MSQHKGQLTVASLSTAQQTNKSRFTLVGVQKYALDVASWYQPAVRGWGEHVRSARVFRTSTCSAIAKASSTSMPRYRTVL